MEQIVNKTMDQTLTVGTAGGYNKVVKLVSVSGQKSVRRNEAGGPGANIDLTISHQEIGKTKKRRRSLYRVDANGSANDGSAIRTGLQIVLEVDLVPGGQVISTAHLKDILVALTTNNAGGDFASFVAGEI